MNFKTRNKLTIGLTGGILCGKSTALLAWKKAGACVLSCDELLREISARPTVQKKISMLFGTTDRAILAQKVFASAPARKKLEKVLHPLVLKEIAKRLRAVKEAVRVVEVPLLFEAGLQNDFDVTVALLAPQKLLAARAKKRAMSRADFLKRSKAQWPLAKKAAHADICLINDGTVQELARQVQVLHRALSKIYHVK